MQVESWQRLATRPFLVRIDVQVVAFQDYQAVGEESLVAILDLDGCRLPFCIFRAASEESPDYKFVDSAIIAGESSDGDIVDRMNWRMGLVVVTAAARPFETSTQESLRKGTPCIILYLLFYKTS